MPDSHSIGVRLRQAVLVAEDLTTAHLRLRDGLRLGEPFRDPNVALFGLENTVFSLGQNFLEIVSPVAEGTAAGTIVSMDLPSPPESWRWGGPEWTGQAGEGAAGRLAGATIRVPDPESAAVRWGEVLGIEPEHNSIGLDDEQTVTFEQGAGGLSEIRVELPGGPSAPLEFGAATVPIA